MDSHFHVHLVFLVLALTIIQGIHAIKYTVSNLVAGERGRLFEKEVGNSRAKKIMKTATEFVWSTVFKQFSVDERKNVQLINLFIDAQINKYSRYYKINDKVYSIDISAKFIEDCPKDHLETEITALIYYEIAHVLQWTVEDQFPPAKDITAIKDGIAGFAVLEANYQPIKWVSIGEGERWDEKRDVTAQFFVYCNKRKPGFVAHLNKRMKTSYSETYIHDYFNENIDELWKDYKAKHESQE